MVPAGNPHDPKQNPRDILPGIFDWTGPFANTQDATRLQILFISTVDCARVTSVRDRSS